MQLRKWCTSSPWQKVRLQNFALCGIFFLMIFFLVFSFNYVYHSYYSSTKACENIILSSIHYCTLTSLYLFYFVWFDFSSSSTFKDPERASLRDSGHGDSDQADSDQDTNKGSCCDMSAKEALKLKAVGVKPPPLEQGELSQGNLSGSEMKEGAFFSSCVCV